MADPAPEPVVVATPRKVWKMPTVDWGLWWIKPLIGLILLVVVAIWAQDWLHDRDDRIARESVAAQAARTAVAAETIAVDAGEVQAETQRVEVVVTQQRSDFIRRAEELKDANPTVQQFVAQPVPVELRDLARKRRESRERLDDPAARGAGADGTEGSRG